MRSSNFTLWMGCRLEALYVKAVFVISKKNMVGLWTNVRVRLRSSVTQIFVFWVMTLHVLVGWYHAFHP
jgi:hypothetical protein